jgi:sulfur carrier protein ThiS
MKTDLLTISRKGYYIFLILPDVPNGAKIIENGLLSNPRWIKTRPIPEGSMGFDDLDRGKVPPPIGCFRFRLKASSRRAVMQVQVKLFVTLRKNRIQNVELPDGSDAQDLIHQLGISLEEVGILGVNGRLATLDQKLEEGNVIYIMPFVGGG